MKHTTALAIWRRQTVQFAKKQMHTGAVGRRSCQYSTGTRTATYQGQRWLHSTVLGFQITELSTPLGLLGGRLHRRPKPLRIT